MRRLLVGMLAGFALLWPAAEVTASAQAAAPARSHRGDPYSADNSWFVLQHCGTRGGLHFFIYTCARDKPATLYIGGPGASAGGRWRLTGLAWSHWNGHHATARGVLWAAGQKWKRRGSCTITLYRARQFFMFTGYYTRLYLAPQFRIDHAWKWIWYQDGSAHGVPLLSGKWVVN
jgi:hypothetical protein